MCCYILFISLALISTSNFVRTASLKSSEEHRKPMKIDINTLKNAAEVVKVLKAINEGGEPDSQQEEAYGSIEEKGLQGIDLDYLGLNDERRQNIQELLELIQKNTDAKENHDVKRSEFTPRVYYISNPDVLEQYKKKINNKEEKDSSAPANLKDSSEKDTEIQTLWELLKTMRRGGDVEKKVFPKQMMHPRLLHLNLEDGVLHVPASGINIRENNKEKNEYKGENREEKKPPKLQILQIVTDAKKDKKEKSTTASNNLELEVTENYKVKDALRTAGYQFHFQDDDTDDHDNAKKDALDDESENNDKKVTKIDFKRSKGKLDDKSLERYKHPKKEKKEKVDDSDSMDDNNKKQNRWGKKEEKRNRWEKSAEKKYRWDKQDDRVKAKFNFNPKREPRNWERNYEMKRPRIKPQLSKSVRENNVFKSFGRTPVPIVGKRGVYEDD